MGREQKRGWGMKEREKEQKQNANPFARQPKR